jgi:hypothetical protein
MTRTTFQRYALLLAVPVAALALAAPALAGSGGGAAAAVRHAHGPAVSGHGSGIVQLVARHFIVVRELDASIVRVAVASKTLVLVNGARAGLADVKPGFVVEFRGPSGKPARVIRAVGQADTHKPAAGTVQSTGADAIVVSAGDGTAVSILVDAGTRVVIEGKPATLADIRPGDVVVGGKLAATAKKPVHDLRLRRPR